MGVARTSGWLVRLPLPGHVRLSKAIRGEFDGLDNLAVAGAAADVTGDRLDDVFSRRTVVPLKQSVRRQDHSWRAEAALQPMGFAECILDDAELARSSGYPFDRRNRVAVGLHREHKTGTHRLAIEQDGAGATNSVFAPRMGSDQEQIVPERIQESLARLDVYDPRATVHFQR